MAISAALPHGGALMGRLYDEALPRFFADMDARAKAQPRAAVRVRRAYAALNNHVSALGLFASTPLGLAATMTHVEKLQDNVVNQRRSKR